MYFFIKYTVIFRQICYKYEQSIFIGYVLCFGSDVYAFSRFDILAEKKLENCADKRLYKEKLCKERERKVKAHKLQPISQQCNKVKSRIVRIIQESGNKAHCGTHKSYGRADYRGFKDYGVSFPRIKNLAGKLE